MLARISTYSIESLTPGQARHFFSPDGKQLAWTGKYEVVLWDTTTGKEQYRLNSYDDIDTIAFSPDGKQLASTGRRVVILWDIVTGREQHMLDSYSAVNAVALSPASKQLVSTSTDQTASRDVTVRTLAKSKRSDKPNVFHKFDETKYTPEIHVLHDTYKPYDPSSGRLVLYWRRSTYCECLYNW